MAFPPRNINELLELQAVSFPQSAESGRAASTIRTLASSISSDPGRGDALGGLLERILPPGVSGETLFQTGPNRRFQFDVERERREAGEELKRQLVEAQIGNIQAQAIERLTPDQTSQQLPAAAVQEYLLAKSQGYPGGIAEYMQEKNAPRNTQIPGRDVPFPEDVFQQQLERAQQSRSSAFSGQEVEPYVESLARGEMGVSQVPAQIRSAVLAAAQQRGINIISDTERGQITSFKKVQPILQGVSDLSERINTASGILARAKGAVERAKAQANYNDDLSEYNALVMGFTPLLARAVGHVGVLTEQDVQSVRELFPKPGDSKSVRDRKIARMNQIMSGVQAATEAGITSPTDRPSTGGGSDLHNISTEELFRMLGQ